VVLSGLVVYFWHSTPEEQGTLDIRVPSYIRQVSDSEVGDEVSDVTEKQDVV